MKMRILFSLVLVIAISGLMPSTVQADGIIIPDPIICEVPPPIDQNPVPPRPPCPPPPHPIPIAQLDIKYHRVTVNISNQIATTHVDQVFFNPNDWTVEGDYIFPLPLDAAVSNFTLWVDGQPVQGQVLDAAQARQKYEEIVSSQRDPALLEYAGRGAVEAHVFPIPPQGERRIDLEYSQALTAENGLVRYIYPLNTEKFSVKPLESVSISVQVSAGQPIRAIYSPTHDISITRQDAQHVTAGYEANNVRPDTDFALYYSLGDSEAFHLLTYRDPTDLTNPDGFYLVLLAPKPEINSQPVPKDLFLVLDKSGSMDGDKFRQAQQALRFILTHLNSQDRFNIITFSTAVETYASGLRSADEAPEALAWVDRLSAKGSTDINRALLEAASMADSTRPTYLIFLTDGLPTNGVTDSGQILNNFAQAAPKNLRLFSFGVGYDVDTILLDSLAEEHHGATTYVKPGDPLDELLSAFYAKISTPVLTNLALEFNQVQAYDTYPTPLPDLFLGSQIIAVGRYHQSGSSDAILTGQVEGETQTFRFPGQVFASNTTGDDPTLAAIPRLWATRKIGYLLNQVRLKGADQETIDQIVRLSIRYGIVTPYTSYLVTEPTALGAEAQQRIAQDQFKNFQTTATPPVSGQAAVEKAAGIGGMAGAEAPAAAGAEAQNQVRVIGSRTFVLADGTWTDTAFDPQTMPVTKVSFLSSDYFALSNLRPDLAAAFSLGEQVIAISNGKVYQVVASGETVQPLNLPASPTPLPAGKTPAATFPVIDSPTQIGTPTVNVVPTQASGPSSNQSSLYAGILLAILLPVALIVVFGRKRG